MFLLDLVFPKLCRHCGDPFGEGLSNILCAACFDSIRPYEGVRCGHCGVPVPGGSFEGSSNPRCADCGEGAYALEETRAFGAYRGPLRLAHHAFKFEGMEGLGTRLADRMAAGIPAPFWEGAAALVPVPMSAERERERGYHPTRLLAKRLGAAMGLPVGEWLRKVRSTPPQMSLSRERRLSALRGAMRYAGPDPAPARAVLVDDVLTTGATLEECARALKRAGVARVQAVVFGRTPRDFRPQDP